MSHKNAKQQRVTARLRSAQVDKEIALLTRIIDLERQRDELLEELERTKALLHDQPRRTL